MYKSDKNYLEGLVELAAKFVVDNDRMLYKNFLETAEKLADEFVIGGQIGIALLLGGKINKDSFVWEIYADNAFEFAKKLATALSATRSPHIPAETVCMQTVLRHREFIISVYARPIIKITSMGKYREVDLMKLIEKITVDGYFGGKVRIFPAEIQLTDVYRCLYTFARQDQWESAVSVEAKLWEKISVGGEIAQNLDQNVAKLAAAIGDDFVFVGDFGASKLLKSKPAGARLHLIGDVKSAVKSAEKCLGGQITFARLQLNLPDDWQVTKYTIYWEKGRKIAIADVYPVHEYETIPFVLREIGPKRAKVGSPWVIMRFLLIDNWSLKLASSISGHDLMKKYSANIALAAAVRKWSIENPAESWPSSTFGAFISPAVSKKKLVVASGEKFHDWYPAKEAKKNKREDL